jgi:ABC-type transport system involved in multi-copper enzyme maturation permease subunit
MSAPLPAAPKPQSPPSYTTAALRVFDLSLGEMLWSRRSVFLALVVGGPVAIALVVRIMAVLQVPALRVNGQSVVGATMFGVMIWALYLRVIVPLLGVFYGTALIADEVDDKTLTYLFTRPIPRGAVLVGKYLAYLACTVFIVLPSVMLVFFLVTPFTREALAVGFVPLLKDLGLLGLGLAAYGALFAFVGAQMKRPLLIGLVFAFGWETVAMSLPGYLRLFTVANYIESMVPHAMPAESTADLFQSIFRNNPPVWVALLALAGITATALALGARAVSRREYVLEQ